VGLLNALPDTQLWKRLEREGRLLGEASGNNTTCTFNFKTRMDPALLIQGYQTIMRTIYSPREYYERALDSMRRTAQQFSEPQHKGIIWDATIFMVLFHVGALAALFTFNWQAVLVSILLWWITASVGVGMGFHRLLTHRGYKTPKLVEYFLPLCGTLTLEG